MSSRKSFFINNHRKSIICGELQPITNNPYSPHYNSGWRNHPNFSWKNNLPTPSQDLNKPPPEKKSDLEEAMTQLAKSHTYLSDAHAEFMTKARTNFQYQAAQIKSLETQVSQIMSLLSKRQVGSQPSKFEINPRREGNEQCNVIVLRSGREIERPKKSVAIIPEKDESTKKYKPKKKAKEAIPPPRESTPTIPFL